MSPTYSAFVLQDSRPNRSYDDTLGGSPKRSVRLPRASDLVTSTSWTQLPCQPREPAHRPHSPKNPTPSPFSTVDLDGSEGESPLIPKRPRKLTVPKIVESAFGRNEQDGPFRPSQYRANSPPESEFELLIERRAAKKTGAPKDPEARSIGDDMTLKGIRDREPGPSTPSTSKRGFMEPRSSPFSSLSNDQPTSQLRPEPPSTTVDVTELNMIKAREELSKLVVRFRDRFPRSSLGPNSPDTRANNEEKHPFDESTHPFDKTTHPFDETTHPFDETTNLLDDSQTQTQEVHPFDDDSHMPSQETHPFDESPQQPHSKSLSHTPPISPINRLRPGMLPPPHRLPPSSQNPATNESATTNGTSRRLRVPTPTKSRSALRTPLSPTEDGPILSPLGVRSRALSPEDGGPKATATRELRELLENSPRGRRVMGHLEAQPQTHGEA